MMKIQEWKNGEVFIRDASPEEIAQAEIDSQMFEKERVLAFNKEILSQLEKIDSKSIRALREGNVERIDMLESEASALRTLLREV